MPPYRSSARAGLAGALLVCVALSSPTRAAGAQRTKVSTAAAATPGSAALDARFGLVHDHPLAAALRDISPARIRATDSTLVSFGTRNSFSDTLSATRGIGAARRWLSSQMQQVSRDCGGCLHVEFDPAMVQVLRHPQKASVNVVNVLGILHGRDTNRVIVMGGHYDSCVCAVGTDGGVDSTSTAPGADDDGSGASAVLELARVISRRYPKGLDATIIFAEYAAEEQGLLGSGHLAQRLKAEGKRVIAGMTDDIIGNVVAENGTTDSTSVRIYAADPDSSGSRELGRYVWALGSIYTPAFEVRPTWRLDRIGRGGDHRPFVEAGWPGLRFTERLENYKRQHLPTDDFAHVNFGYVAQVARLNAATLLSLASAPASPDSVTVRRENASSGGQSWAMRWAPVAGATSYEVLVRRTWSPTWERVIPVGTATAFTLDYQLDDGWTAVRAVGANGHRSLARTAGAPVPPRPYLPPAR